MTEPGPIDVAVLVIYLVGITALGIRTVRRVHTLPDFFMPRRFSKAMMITHAFGTGTTSDQAVIVASATFRYGLSGIWYQCLWRFATPLYWIIAAVMRRFRAVTTADVFALRYDHSVARLFAPVGFLSMAVKIGLMLKGSAALIESGTRQLIDADGACSSALSPSRSSWVSAGWERRSWMVASDAWWVTLSNACVRLAGA